MKLLSAIFNRPQTVNMTRATLAAIAAPFINRGAKPTNAAISHAFSETAEWLRIGFDGESDKGSMYYGLHYALCRIADTVKQSPESVDTFAIKREWLELIKAGAPQLCEASRALDLMSRKKANYQPTYVKDRQGNVLQVPFTQIYNRPDAAHDVMGMRLEEVFEILQDYFEGTTIKPASHRTLRNYEPQRR